MCASTPPIARSTYFVCSGFPCTSIAAAIPADAETSSYDSGSSTIVLHRPFSVCTILSAESCSSSEPATSMYFGYRYHWGRIVPAFAIVYAAHAFARPQKIPDM